MGQALLLTGQPGVGKTTVIKQVVQALGTPAGGFYTEELRGPGGRQGFRLVTLDGQTAILAHVNIRGRRRVGRYGVDVEALDRVGVAAIKQALALQQIVVIDEVGKMELFSSLFQAAVLQAISSPCLVIATVMRKSHVWVNALQAMPQVTLWEVTLANRSGLPARVLAWLEKQQEAAR